MGDDEPMADPNAKAVAVAFAPCGKAQHASEGVVAHGDALMRTIGGLSITTAPARTLCRVGLIGRTATARATARPQRRAKRAYERGIRIPDGVRKTNNGSWREATVSAKNKP